jgi:predicted kinase
VRASLVLLNGAPGCGKSTVARLLTRGATAVVVDPDDLRLAGADAAGARAQALSSIAGHLGGGRTVVVPQLVARVDQLERFELVARAAGAGFVQVLLVDDADDPVGRYRRVTGGDGHPARADLDDDRLRSYLAGLDDVRAARPGTHVVPTAEGDPGAAADAVLHALADVLVP